VTRVNDPRGALEGGTIVSEKWHPAFHGLGCRWGDTLESPTAQVNLIAAPGWARSSSFERVGPTESAARENPYAGEEIDVPGASEAWQYCIDVDGQVRSCGVDLLVEDVWMQVRAFDAASTSAIAARIAENLEARA